MIRQFLLVHALVLGFLGPARAAYIHCEYRPQACNIQGDHFLCAVINWTIQPPFCSAIDKSNLGPRPRPGTLVRPSDFRRQDSPDDYCLADCGRRCLEPPIFCGGW